MSNFLNATTETEAAASCGMLPFSSTFKDENEEEDSKRWLQVTKREERHIFWRS